MVEELTKVHLATIKNIGKEIAPDIRITRKALLKLQDIATDFIRMTLNDANNLSKHRDRKTIDEKDVVLATQ